MRNSPLKVKLMSRTNHKRAPASLGYEDMAEKIKDIIPKEKVSKKIEGPVVKNLTRNVSIRTFPIAIGIPMDEVLFSQFLSNLMNLSIMPWDMVLTSVSTFVCDARNKIHNGFIESKGPTHLFMIDSDVLPPPDTIERLLRHDLPVVGGWYRKKERFSVKDLDGTTKQIQRPVVYDYDSFDEKIGKYLFTERFDAGKGLEKVDGMGAGCWMIRRDVAEAIGKDPFSLDFGGEDLTFCKSINKAGFDVIVDWDIACAHAGVSYV